MHRKLADFGFATELPQLSHGKTMFSSLAIASSEGYYPSEVTSGHFSDRSDVYCYGMVCSIIKSLYVIYIISFCTGDIRNLYRPICV